MKLHAQNLEEILLIRVVCVRSIFPILENGLSTLEIRFVDGRPWHEGVLKITIKCLKLNSQGWKRRSKVLLNCYVCLRT